MRNPIIIALDVPSAEEAIRNGADYLVIGREITRASDPAAATRRILTDLGSSPA